MNKHVLVIAEKPQQAKIANEAFEKEFPGEKIIYIHLVPVVNPAFDYKDHAKSGQVINPVEPNYSFDGVMKFIPPRHFVNGEYVPVTGMTNEEIFAGATQIINFTDPDYSGVTNFHIAAQHFYGENYLETMKVSTVTMMTFDKECMHKSVEERQPGISPQEEKLSYGLAKKHFDYNWNLNSLSILTPLLIESGVNATISKYELLILQALQGQDPVSEGEITVAMSQWKGTGEYEKTSKVGSEVSRWAILENLQRARLLSADNSTKPVKLKVTEIGEKFLSKLSPNSFFPDLPFLLDDVFSQDLTIAKAKIDDYIKKQFTEQVEFTASNGFTNPPSHEDMPDWRLNLFKKSAPAPKM